MNNSVEILVNAHYIAEQSRPENDQFVYAYTIRIENKGDNVVQLLSRKWIITDAQNKVQEVQGEGVIGQQPTLAPGKSFTYTSGAVIATDSGTMTGTYTMQNDQGEHFDVEIPTFALVRRESLH